MTAASQARADEPAADEDDSASLDYDVLDVTGAMALLKVGRNAVYAGCARGEIPHRRIGKLLRFSRAALHTWLASSMTIPPTAQRKHG